MRCFAAVVLVTGMAGGLVWLAESAAAWREPIGRGETRMIRVHVPAGQTVVAGIEQFEIDLTLSAEYPDGRVVEGSDRGPYGRETLLFVTDAEGDYAVTIRANGAGSLQGQYGLDFLEYRRTRESDFAAIKAQELFVQAEELERRVSAVNQERARALYGEAAGLFRAGGVAELEAQAKNFEGRALDWSGRRDAAYACYVEALSIRERVGDEYGRMETLLQIGRLSGHLRERFAFVPDDLGFLAWWQRLGDRRGIAHAMSVVSAYFRRQKKDLPVAARWAERSVGLARELGDRPLESRCLKSLVSAHLDSGRFDEALVHAKRILMLQRELRDARGEAAALGMIGMVLENARRDGEAASYIRQQLKLQRTLGDATAMTGSLSLLREVYGRLGDHRTAAALLKEEVSLHFQVAGEYASDKWRSAYLGHAANIDAVARDLVAAGRVEDSLADVDRLRAEALGRRETHTVSELLAQLGKDTVLLATLMGRERSYVWVASEAGVWVHLAPDAKRMTALATRVWNCYASRKECGAEARELSRILLGPAWKEIRGKRLVVSSDGILSYLPFAALPDPSREHEVPILEEQEVVQIPSLAVLAWLREEGDPVRAPVQVTVLADPVYDAQDARLQAQAPPLKLEADLVRALERGGLEREKGAIPRLWHTEAEMRAVFGALPEGVRRTAYTGFEATREALLKPVARGAILHIATHGIVNTDDPELSGLVLSLLNREGRPLDGYVRLRDVGALNIPARLIVLSACQTACGREYFGQGAFSLASAFLMAGAKSVVASNWKVSDEATAELMKLFYRHLMSDAEMRVPAALRAAQIELRRDGRWNLPYFWAAFAAHGEWR